MIKKNNCPSIGIDAADLCYPRIDGTRIYIWNLLQRLGAIAPDTRFEIYLKGEINPGLNFRSYPNYHLHKAKLRFLWTQLRFPFMLRQTRPDVLWMPLHNLPFFKPKNIKTVVTVHDLAFKLFPDFFPKKDLVLLNKLTAYAVKNADRIIAVSRSTANDIAEVYGVSPYKIRVIHHGYNDKTFHLPSPKEKEKIPAVLEKFKIPKNSRYLIYVGAIQPRKNLSVLVSAFERIKTLQSFKDWKLVLAGEEAWLFDELKKQIKTSVWSRDIIMTGKFETKDLPYLLWGAETFVFPSLYEGFGIPILEAMASGVPVITAKNSSLVEVAGDAGLYFDARRVDELATLIKDLNHSPEKKKEMIEKGLAWCKRFSWEKTAKETYNCLIDTALRS